ncbi:peptidoglycan-associated lipoprotein Pal [Pantoea sp. Mhis]|uniref:peptidoglycan-associated lipoprotein Pal n=1 Tax=Pantoea sp. Mhis TaxID=2576759 RepID=UPI00135A0969|nr:peptidoglycan-associated lipoprotein Pal [Pantoea sp. Mhis]MXP56294.1 peptidoglycan-associated lipoprotein Pal [Pantoea sp. Mhis]
MQLNKILMGLIWTILLVSINGCSSQKNKNYRENNSTNPVQQNKVNSNEQTFTQLQQHNIVYFDLNKYNLKSDAIDLLNQHINFMINNPSNKIIIEGHTDERGTPEYNIALGEKRANAVKIYLESRGISTKQLSIVSYGKEKPAVIGHDEVSYAKNRRAIINYQRKL